jgi:hypothetical protein
LFDNYPGLFAVFHARHRLLTPRHPPCALSSLTTNIHSSTPNSCSYTAATCRVFSRQVSSWLHSLKRSMTAPAGAVILASNDCSRNSQCRPSPKARASKRYFREHTRELRIAFKSALANQLDCRRNHEDAIYPTTKLSKINTRANRLAAFQSGAC